MEIFKADWLCHLKDTRKGGGPSSIFSISVDSTGKRLASAGLDSTIRVWNVEALTKPDEPRILAAMTRHDGAVLCVKWSPAGAKNSYLASGADDSIVLIWKREKDGPGMAGAFEFDHEKLGLNPPTEAYRVVHRLTDHTSDVAGLEWSPDGRWLASCGLDGVILIWEVEAGFRLAHKLEGHKGFVKGVAWDPSGVFLASQSDDHSMIVWRTRDWKAETILTRPFDQAHEETFFRRPSWSPDGRLIAASNAVNGMQPVVSLVLRDEWKPEIAFVGHLLAVEVARFSPCLYRRKGAPEDEAPTYLCAAGSQDCNTSIWSDKLSKPIVVLTDLFEHSVMDLEWLPDGLHLLVAAYDGTIALIRFSLDFVGNPLKAAEQSEYLAQIRKNGPGDVTKLPTSVEQIRLLAERDAAMMDIDHPPSNNVVVNEAEEEEEVIVKGKSLRVQPVLMQVMTPTKQVESKTKEGKRRITPFLVQESPSAAEPLQIKRPSEKVDNGTRPNVGYSIRQLPEEKLVLKLSTKAQPRLLANYKDRQVEVKNVLGKGQARITFSDTNRIYWDNKVDSVVLMMEACEELIVLIMDNRTFFVINFEGRRVLPPLALGGNPVAISMAMNQGAVCVLIVMDSGDFKIWNLTRLQVDQNGSLAGIAKGAAITRLQLSDSKANVFMVGFSDGRVYSYIPSLDAFTQTNGSVFKAIEYGTEGISEDPRDTLKLIKDLMLEDPEVSRKHSISFLETRLALSALTDTKTAFISAAHALVTRLLLESQPTRLLDLIHSLSSANPYRVPLSFEEHRQMLSGLRDLVVRTVGSGDASFAGIASEIDFIITELQ